MHTNYAEGIEEANPAPAAEGQLQGSPVQVEPVQTPPEQEAGDNQAKQEASGE